MAKISQTHIQKAIAEIGIDHDVPLQGRFETKPIRIEIEIDSQNENHKIKLSHNEQKKQ